MTGRELAAVLDKLTSEELDYPVMWETRYDGHSDLCDVSPPIVDHERLVISRKVQAPAVAQPWLRKPI